MRARCSRSSGQLFGKHPLGEKGWFSNQDQQKRGNHVAETGHPKLAALILNRPEVLNYARNIATAIVNGPKNHCAATLSARLVFVGIFPKGGGTGSGDLEVSRGTLRPEGVGRELRLIKQ